MPLWALTPRQSEYTAGAITVAEVVTMDGAIIIVGETSPPGGDYSEESRLRLAAFLFEPSCLGCVATRKSRQGFPRRLAVALRLHGGVLRRAVSNVAVPTLSWDARPQ